MEQTVIRLVNGIVAAIMWTIIYIEAFKGSILESKPFAAFHSFILILIQTMLINIPSISSVICVVVSASVLWAFEKKISPITVINCIIVFLVLKIIYLFSAIPVISIFSLFGCGKEKGAMALTQLIVQELMCIVAINYFQENELRVILEKRSAIIVGISEILFLITYTYIKKPYFGFAKGVRIYVIFVMIALFTILLIWGLDKTTNEKRIRSLLRSAHKFKETIPAIDFELHRLYYEMRNLGHKRDIKELGKAINEISTLRKEYGIEEQADYFTEQTFETTGIELLDSQLLDEQGRAIERGIEFKVIVREPVSDLARQGVLNQTLIQRILGDLFRNALRAVEQRGGGGEILLSMGRTARGYQIRISDTGVPFDAAVLNRIGTRGASTGGSGHGLADTLEALGTCRASLQIDDYGFGQRTYSKGVSIRFDGLGKLKITSARREVPDRIYDIEAIAAENRRREPRI